MEIFMKLFEYSLLLGLFWIAITILLIWMFIKTAIASGTKKGILDAYEQIKIWEKNPPLTPEEELKKELEAWK